MRILSVLSVMRRKHAEPDRAWILLADSDFGRGFDSRRLHQFLKQQRPHGPSLCSGFRLRAQTPAMRLKFDSPASTKPYAQSLEGAASSSLLFALRLQWRRAQHISDHVIQEYLLVLAVAEELRYLLAARGIR